MTTILTYLAITAALLLAFAAMTTQGGYEDSPSLVMPHPVWGKTNKEKR
jgi:hypothetical protein